jgi:hypothetical protein
MGKMSHAWPLLVLMIESVEYMHQPTIHIPLESSQGHAQRSGIMLLVFAATARVTTYQPHNAAGAPRAQPAPNKQK